MQNWYVLLMYIVFDFLTPITMFINQPLSIVQQCVMEMGCQFLSPAVVKLQETAHYGLSFHFSGV